MTDHEFRSRYARLVPRQAFTPSACSGVAGGVQARDAKNRTAPRPVRQFRATRYISNREKISGGSLGVGFGVGVVFIFALASWTPLEGIALLLGAVVPGGAIGGGVFARAMFTGMMDD